VSRSYRKRSSRNRKRERRIKYREKRLAYEQSYRSYRRKIAEEKARAINAVSDVIRNDNKKPGKPCKKPGPEKFLELYSYIVDTAFDSRSSIPTSWKPHSFNERKQNLEFLKRFVYPYPLPETLLCTTYASEYFQDENGDRFKSQDYALIRLAKKWINDIVSGETLYQRNKRFFTESEAHYFLCSNIPYTDGSSVINMYFYAKFRARAMNHKLSITVAEVFAAKFLNCFKARLVESFLDLIARTPEYRYERSMLGDICDFVLEKMRENKNQRNDREAFSFSGRTIEDIIKLANDRHECLRKKENALLVQRNALFSQRQEYWNKESTIDTSHWKGMGLKQFMLEAIEGIWTVIELISEQDFFNQKKGTGNWVMFDMCSYAPGNNAFFSVEQIYPKEKAIIKRATLEVRLSDRTIVQARGKNHTSVSVREMNIITRWSQENGIKVGPLV